jgi:hypothetical protein
VSPVDAKAVTSSARAGLAGAAETVLRSAYRRYKPTQARLRGRPSLPLTGFPTGDHDGLLTDDWSDAQLGELNALLDWRCFTVDSAGRRLGQPAGHNKRQDPQVIPDPRIVQLDEVVGLAGKHVLEVGCFEGVHTIALCERAARVTALDSRTENVVKTLVRTRVYGHAPELLLCDVEAEPASSERLRCDVLHHNGVLYHLKDPVTHLVRITANVSSAILLDTHYALPEETTASYTAGDGRSYPVKIFGENDRANPFAGMYDIARWLTLDDLKAVLARCGFTEILVEQPRAERNGPRVLLIVSRAATGQGDAQEAESGRR